MSELIAGFLDGLRPVKRIFVDQWADENVYLPTENSAEPGPYRTDRMPYLRQIMRDLSPTSRVNEVIFIKGVQIGATTVALNVAGTYIDIDPCPIMYVMPTTAVAESLSKDRFTPMVEKSKALAAKIGPARERDSGNTILSKSFAGGRMYFTGANSAASLRSKPIRVLLADEIDAWPLDADGEGSPLSLAEKRQSTFGDRRKTFKLSTPTIKGASVIEMEYETTDQRKYFVPCPHCATAQTMEFENLKWDPENKENVWLECVSCHEKIEERYKTRMLAAGVWIATAPQNASLRRVGYFLNSLYSPHGQLYWHQIVDQWLKAQNDPFLYKTFVNSILGQTYEEKGESPEWERLHARRGGHAINTLANDTIAFITSGVDIQRDRIEVEIVAWCANKVSYSVDYRVFWGDTTQPAVWLNLDALLAEVWTRPDGSELSILKMAVDSSDNTSTVYDWVEKKDPQRVVAIKGDAKLREIVATPKAVQTNKDGKKVGSVRLWRVGVSLLKSELYGFLRLDAPTEDKPDVMPGYCYFPEYDSKYFKMITAERLQLVRNAKGFITYEWVLPSHARNEALDCRVYARAAASILGMDRMKPEDFETVRTSYGIAPPPKKPKAKKEGGFLNGGSIWDD